MLVLALDTATPAVTVALYDGARVLAERTTIDARRHGELLAPSIAAVLSEAGASRRDLTHVVSGTGPGPYTGLRVGLMTAQALAAALGILSYGMCTLDALAFASGRTDPFIVATDARRKEVFWARYGDARTRSDGPFVAKPDALPGGLPIIGAGVADGLEPRFPSAAAIAALAVASFGTLGPAVPIYLRRPDARVPGPPKRVTA